MVRNDSVYIAMARWVIFLNKTVTMNMKCGYLTTMYEKEISICRRYSTANGSLYCQVVCCVPVSCKANSVGNQFGAWRYSDLLAILYSSNVTH